MHKILLSITNIKKSINNIDVMAFEINEKEGTIPTAFVTFSSNQLTNIEQLTSAVLKDNNIVLFSGVITNIQKGQNTTILTMTKPQKEQKIEQTTVDQDIIDLLYDNENLEIPEVFCKLSVPYYDKVSDSSSIISIVSEHSSPIILDKKIIKNSLQVKTATNSAISNINLEISCSWFAKVDGDIDITSKIAKKFQGGRINTLTPKSLETSWPRFGERIAGTKSARQSKYYIGHSRLVQENMLHMNSSDVYTPPIDIGAEKPIRLRRAWYNHKLSLCFGYEQYRKETIKVLLKNELCSSAVSRNVKINLRSVQEYLDSDYTTSFFQTELGRKAYKYIIKMVALYMSVSMRDTIITFSIPYDPNITSGIWIIVNGQIAQISSLKFKSNHIIEVEALGFSNDNFRQFLKKTEDIIVPPELEKQSLAETTSGDIMHDIVVENDGATQTQKLCRYLNGLSGKINQSNYKQIINKFLNENKTSITIITKPLKTEYCEHKVIDLGEASVAYIH